MNLSTYILVIRHNGEFSQVLREGGLSVIDLPLIKTEPLDDLSDLRAILDKIDDYDGLVFTSPVSAEIFLKELNGRDRGIRGDIYVIGARANRILTSAGLATVFNDSVNSAEELVDSDINRFNNKKLLFVRGDKSMLTIPNMLKERAAVDQIVVYRTSADRPDERTSENIAEKINDGAIQWVCFFSPSAVEVFKDVFGNGKRIRVAVIGKTTAHKARELGFDVQFISPRSDTLTFGQGFLSFIND